MDVNNDVEMRSQERYHSPFNVHRLSTIEGKAPLHPVKNLHRNHTLAWFVFSWSCWHLLLNFTRRQGWNEETMLLLLKCSYTLWKGLKLDKIATYHNSINTAQNLQQDLNNAQHLYRFLLPKVLKTMQQNHLIQVSIITGLILERFTPKTNSYRSLGGAVSHKLRFKNTIRWSGREKRYYTVEVDQAG